jgi:hypothetical protein
MTEQFCDYHLRCPAAYWTLLFMNFTVVLDISSSSRCCHRLCERLFSYYAPNSTRNKRYYTFSGKLKFSVRKSVSEKVRPKKSYFSSAYEYVKLPFSLRVPRKVPFQYFLAILFYMFYLE